MRQVEFFRTLSKRPLTSPYLANEKPGPGGSGGVTFGLFDVMLVCMMAYPFKRSKLVKRLAIASGA